ncbi:MAG: isocitrate/isopropylmalate dehydrogenase family protein [Nitrososphaerota archaeon]|jgi:isopropylmalate/isohomocitrate dehydrogenase-like protein|uniref:isocitrate/isopropylmalate dehydrogenase family protein n=1 Tax=Candidatus Bathycorpusculum sp. TaxID=2994959 RepID=UPI0028326A85|nr:isocitrate/isopropylmalate dehydrogenase family protein [Candidatus Termitimicrobium sp.]MCL2431407.1 isocitrate/isopropylmalate dehydrogenase family protein [Candidatus Termitimicrobium sp.]MDR0493972.1 isocitrate/isopropylmalate dehydrogenase family protein [Nitrososphaerota archaeon]
MTKSYSIVALKGDGIGPEVTEATIRVLEAVEKKSGFKLNILYGEAGAHCIPEHGTNLPKETIELIKQSNACLKGPMTTPEEAGAPVSVAVTLRRMFGLYANVRPCRTFPNVESLKPNIDLVVVRENTEGLYSGVESLLAPGVGIALRIITKEASFKVADFAFKLAMQRRKHLTYIHKGNILRITDGIFKDAVKEAQKNYPEVEVDDLHIDAATMQLIKQPEKYDVMVTTNLFGDILSDEAAQVTGSLGLAAGANIGVTYGMFEPVHGSAPKYTGMNRVNPIATIMAGAMMLDWLGESAAAKKIEEAIIAVLKEGKVRTHDLGGEAKGTEITDAIIAKI